MVWLARQAWRWHPGLGALTAAVLLVPPMMATGSALPPADTEHNRTMLEYLQRHRRPGDLVYVFPLQRIGTTYYGPEYGLHPDDWTSAVCAPGDARASLRDVDRFRGTPRLWVLSAAARPFRVNHELVARYLAAIGERRDHVSRPSRVMGRVDLELWDLSASRLHSRASAETFAVPPFNGPAARCRDWSQPHSRPGL